MAGKKASPLVGIVMGSPSDLPTMELATGVLAEFGVAHEVVVASAHRSPERAANYAKTARRRGVQVIIAGAGGGAHLAGVLASHLTIPVIGVPMQTDALGGMDSLLSTVQMPSGIPVATVAIGGAGAKNAALLAIEILALSDEGLSKKLTAYRKKLAKKVESASASLSSREN